MALKQWLSDLLGVVYPATCPVCGNALSRGEEVICLQCLADMPRCRFHKSDFNAIHQKLVGTQVLVDRAAALFFYSRKSPYVGLIHRAKYDGQPRIIRWLAETLAREIQADGFFDGIDLIIPVPLHRGKLRRRGYNQSHVLAEGLEAVTGIPVGDNLQALKPHDTQTRRDASARWQNADGVYSVEDAGALAGKHVLVVDDVITTGATIHSCCLALLQAQPTIRLSVLSIGVTSLD